MRDSARCPNMNHGRLNPPVKFCPTCGDSINKSISNRCNDLIHKARRKDRGIYCQDCGKKLAS